MSAFEGRCFSRRNQHQNGSADKAGRIATLAVFLLLLGAFQASGQAQLTSKRVAAEWEPQEAIWLQWPGPYEQDLEPAFASLAAIISRFEKLHILCASAAICEGAGRAIRTAGTDPGHANINWHEVASDSAWMRDNGPVYVIEDGRMRVQDWQFDAWGGAFGEAVSFAQDNRVPVYVAQYLGLPVDTVDIVHERGNLEFNGVDTLMLNWSTLGDPDRNPGYIREQAVADLKARFGVTRVIMLEGIPRGDLTRGHIDGFARFISPDTAVVAQCTVASYCKPGDGADGTIYDNAAATISAAGLKVIRDPIEGQISYEGERFDTNYLNWLVGNGFVIVTGFGNPATDAVAKARIARYFPGREVFMVDMRASWLNGGGVHCHTNDQPALSMQGAVNAAGK